MMDALVTMISFLMYTMAFLSFTMIESPLPIVSPDTNQQQLRDRPLQLTVTVNENDILIWSPFDLIPQQKITNKPDGSVDFLKLHESLIAIKQKFLNEDKVILVPQGVTSYDTIVSVIDSIKNFEKTDPIISIKNPKTGIQEQAKYLFSEIVFGNLLGGDE
jgi:biopolymer transport protein ExbD